MTSYTFKLLVGDRFLAECKKPQIKENNQISLKGNATCRIDKWTKEEELKSIKYTFSQWSINENNSLSDFNELYCLCCKCERNERDLHNFGCIGLSCPYNQLSIYAPLISLSLSCEFVISDPLSFAKKRL